jgi:large subunit ribosomal protein L22
MSKKIIAKAKFMKGSPRKMRYVLDGVRDMEIAKAIETLKVLPHRAAKSILKVYQQAVGNAKSNFSLSPADLVIESAQILEGPRYKRRDAHAHGARHDSGVRHKKLSHIVLTVVSRKELDGAKS